MSASAKKRNSESEAIGAGTCWGSPGACSQAKFGYGKYLIVPFWYASAAYKARLVSPKYEPWLDQILLIAAEAYQKGTIRYK